MKKQILLSHLVLLTTLVAFQNCSPGFSVSDLASSSALSLSTAALQSSDAYGKNELHRLTSYEIVNSLNDIFGVKPNPANLPVDESQNTPFSNDQGTQAIAPITIQSYNLFAEEYAATVVAQSNFTQAFAAKAGCTPSGVSDRACYIKYLMTVGTQVMRRPFTSAEASLYADSFMTFAASENKFGSAVELAIQAWIQNPEFLYRVQVGTVNVNGVIALNDYEIATQMSYLLLGTTPDDQLLKRAQAGELQNSANRIAEAKRLLADPKAQEQWHRFHAEWLGYAGANLPAALAGDMVQESNKLIDRIVFEDKSDWLNLFRSQETYLTPALAAQYGLTGVAKTGWVKYANGRGGGILAHATFLAKGAKFGDTSPTLRGYEVFKRLMCGSLGPVPDDIDIDSPPGNAQDCKPKRYYMRTVASCAGCHNITDNIGFGLENFGVAGEWRTTEPGNPSCQVESQGVVNNVSYSGPEALGALLANDPAVSQCAVTQLFRFYTGRKETTEDRPALVALKNEYLQTRSLQSILFAMVGAEAFSHKVEN